MLHLEVAEVVGIAKEGAGICTLLLLQHYSNASLQYYNTTTSLQYGGRLHYTLLHCSTTTRNTTTLTTLQHYCTHLKVAEVVLEHVLGDEPHLAEREDADRVRRPLHLLDWKAPEVAWGAPVFDWEVPGPPIP